MNSQKFHSPSPLYDLLLADANVQNLFKQLVSETQSVSIGDRTLELVQFRQKTKSYSSPSRVTFLKDAKSNSLKCVQRGEPVLEECQSLSLPSFDLKCQKGKLQTQSSQVDYQREKLRKTLGKMTQNRGTVQLIKVQLAHGRDFQVSYALQQESWIISDCKETALLPSNLNELDLSAEDKLKKLKKLWIIMALDCDDFETLKKILSKYTFCGKMTSDAKSVNWYSVVATNNEQSLCEDLFDAKALIEKVGFHFARIKTISVLNNEDQMIRVLQKQIMNVESACSEGRNHRCGRSKVYFISNNNKQVLGGFNINTLEDLLFTFMRKLGFSQTDEAQKVKLFEQKCRKCNQLNFRFPFPLNHYVHLFKKLLKLLRVCSVDQKYYAKNWLELLKLVLYLEQKKISIDNFGLAFMNSYSLREYLCSVSLEQLGPINCSIITLYCLINPSPSFREGLVKALQSKFAALQLPFQLLKCSSRHQINLAELVATITSLQPEKNRVNHLFIEALPRIYQLRCLIKELQMKNNEQCHYKLGIILQKEELFVNVEENIYPFSINALADAYHENFLSHYQATKIAEKAAGMSKVTQTIQNLKNEEFRIDEVPIRIDLGGGEETKKLRDAVQSILKDKKGSYNPYYVLMLELGKRKLSQRCDFEAMAEQIIGQTYQKVKTLAMQ